MQHFVCTPATHPAPAALFDRLVVVARTRWQAYRRNRQLRATVRMLQGLGDHTLKDIGLDRSEIESVVASECARHRRQHVDARLF